MPKVRRSGCLSPTAIQVSTSGALQRHRSISGHGRSDQEKFTDTVWTGTCLLKSAPELLPTMMADNHIGEWNSFEITMKGDRLTVELNGHIVIDQAQLPEVPAKGRIALQHHGHKVNGVWASSPSLVQFRNISIKEL
jgi:hypothetical protein